MTSVPVLVTNWNAKTVAISTFRQQCVMSSQSRLLQVNKREFSDCSLAEMFGVSLAKSVGLNRLKKAALTVTYTRAR